MTNNFQKDATHELAMSWVRTWTFPGRKDFQLSISNLASHYFYSFLGHIFETSSGHFFWGQHEYFLKLKISSWAAATAPHSPAAPPRLATSRTSEARLWFSYFSLGFSLWSAKTSLTTLPLLYITSFLCLKQYHWSILLSEDTEQDLCICGFLNFSSVWSICGCRLAPPCWTARPA